MDKKIVILGGGTYQPIRSQLSLASMSFGDTAKKLNRLLPNSTLYLTKMADPNSTMITNDDVEKHIDYLLKQNDIGCIIFNVDFCDFRAKNIYNHVGNKIGVEESINFTGEKLSSSEGNITIELNSTDKVIQKIRQVRPDIFLVGFKNTTNKTTDEQFLIGLKMMKTVKCNLVLATDNVTQNRIIITPEESYYCDGIQKQYVLRELANMVENRYKGIFTPTELIPTPSVPVSQTSNTFQTVLRHVIDNKGFIENNGCGFTPSHFCEKVSENEFLSSQRKANHNKVFEEGLTRVVVEDNGDDAVFKAYGDRKPSVGARSQWLILKAYPDYDCILHTHNPLKSGSLIPHTSQKEFQCGSLSCGINTLSHLGQMGDNIKAVYLDKHGAVVLFKSTDEPQNVIKFLDDNIQFGVKTT